MSEWIEYTGSTDQIGEINASESFLLKRKDGEISFILQPPFEPNEMDGETIAEYLICQPHPYADLIKIWADTRCPVWYKHKLVAASGECGPFHLPFSYPDICEYSLTPFED